MRIGDGSSDVCSSDLAAGLHVGGVPRLRAERAQEGGRVEGAGADFEVERLHQHAALRGPVGVELLDELLEGRSLHRRRSQEKAGQYSGRGRRPRSEEHTSELQSLMRISYAVFCLKKKIKQI